MKPGAAPEASRPDGGYWEPEPAPELAWAWAAERLAAARNYWVTTKRSDGRAYARPVWGVWLDGAVYFESWSMSANIKADARVSVHLESGDEVVIVEGDAQLITDPGVKQRFVDAYNPKYRWDWTPEKAGFVFAVRPRVAFGWMSDPSGSDRGAMFARSGTRWTFED